MNRPEPQHQSVDQTYAVAVGEMLRRAERLQRRLPDDRRDVDWREVAYTLLLLSHLQSHLAEAATAIHDLWSAERLARGFRFGSDPSRGRHPLLKPLDAFTSQELVIETNLARGDLESIDRVLRAAYPDVAPTSVDGSAGLSGVAPEPSQRLLLRLSRDHQFLQRVAPLVHENWRQVKATAGHQGDTRLHRPFPAMAPRDQQHTLGNVRTDLLALAVLADNRQ